MNIVNKLTLRHLHLNRGRTLITIIGIMLSVAMVCAVAGFVLSLRDMLMREIKERKGDYHVVYVDVTKETVLQIADEDVFSTYYTKDGNSVGLTNIYLRLKNPESDVLEVARSIAQENGVENWGINNELLALEGVFAQDNVMLAFVWIAVIAVIIIVAGSVIVIANAFYISASERVRQFGLLKSAGATKGQIGRSILFEAFVLAAVAIPLGVLLGFLIQAVVLWLTNDLLRDLNNLNNNMFTFRVVFSPIIICISVAVASLTLLVSAWLPARRAAQTSPIDAIRRTQDIKVRSRQLRTSRLTGKLFGFEGTLAAKSLKRSRGKYRSTVVALTTSVVLFISVYSFVWVLNKGVQMEYGGYDLDVLLSMTGDLEKIDDMYHVLTSMPDTDVKIISRTAFETLVPESFFTENALNGLTDQGKYGLLLYPMPDAEFSKIVSESPGVTDGILINTTGTVTIDSTIREYAPYNCQISMQLSLSGKSSEGEPLSFGNITIAAIENKIPDSILAPLFEGSYINIIVSETTYRNLYQVDNSFVDFAVKTANPDNFCKTAENLLLSYGDTFSMWNVSQITRLNRNITLVVSLFGYGFIAMLSLITVTSVIATISTGMALRRQEFAMLYSAGMTSKGMNKMLNLESLLYGLKSLVIGLPIGMALSYLIYKGMTNVAVFVYQPPWLAIAISIAAVMLLTFATMRYSRSKMKKVSIVEAIRSETA